MVHTASFPYFSLLAAALVRPLRRFRLVVDWHEVWSGDYWREYLGPVGGRIGQAVQSLCLRVPQRAFCFSELHARRLRERAVNGELTVLEGEYAGPLEAREPAPAEPLVVFAGRHIPEKRVPALVPALALARERIPELRGELLGDGPERDEVLRLRSRHGLDDVLDVPGFVSAERVESALARALCMVLPSRREGYGMIVVEAAALGTPSVVVAGPDNAAAELVDDGRERLRGAPPPRRRTSPRRSSACTRRASRCASEPRRGSRANARAAVARVLARDGSRGLRAPVGRRRSARAVRSQVKAAARVRGRSRAAARIGERPLDRLGGSSAGSSGFTSTAAPPATSGSEARFEHTTGTPRIIASSTGRPKPS